MPVDFLILGAGVAGLAAGAMLGDEALILEAQSRPGGLVRSFRIPVDGLGDFWFDHVLHLLYMPDAATAEWVHALPGLELALCPPVAWVDTPNGTVRYPFQMHLAGLPSSVIQRCIRDLAEVTFRPSDAAIENFEQHLLATFGRGMCDAFLFPYNRKMWRRDLDTLAPSGFQWTITPPDFDQVLAGALETEPSFRPYNAHGEYPRPPIGADLRGMECLTQALASQVSDLRCGKTVTAIDPTAQTVTTSDRETYQWQEQLIATLPLPFLITHCAGAPSSLVARMSHLTCNRVISAAFAIEGPRRPNRGHWRYNSDESIGFTRVIHMEEFDPLAAPESGYGLLVEITQRAEDPLVPAERLLDQIELDLRRRGDLAAGDRLLARQHVLAEPAYVVFTQESQAAVADAQAWLKTQGIAVVGRYGRWEYSSMGQVMRDGRALALELLGQRTKPVEAPG